MNKYLFYFDSGRKQSTSKSRSDTELYTYTLLSFNQTIPLCVDKTGLTGGFLGAERGGLTFPGLLSIFLYKLVAA